jgi:hypothetical protein
MGDSKNERPIGEMMALYEGDPQKTAWALQLLQFLRPRGEGKTITVVGTNPPRILDLYTFYMLVHSRGGSDQVSVHDYVSTKIPFLSSIG